MHIVRITLHDETDYDPLHRAMAKRKLSKYITASDGRTYRLPDGTYFSSSNASAESIRIAASAAAAAVGHWNPMIIVGRSDEVRFSGLKEADLLEKMYDDLIALGA